MAPGFLAAVSLVAVSAAACLPSVPAYVSLREDDAAPPPEVDLTPQDAATARDDLGLSDFVLAGATPSHGSFRGGERVVLTGRGFSARLRIFFGATEVPASDIVATDSAHVAVTTPSGKAGPVDIRVVDLDRARERSLSGGYLYDALALEPRTGSPAGGTRVALHADGASLLGVRGVLIDGASCTELVARSDTLAECTTPEGTPGAKSVEVTYADGSTMRVADGFTYADAPDAYRGGLSGGALAGKLTVLTLDSMTGGPMQGVTVIVGQEATSALFATSSAAGRAVFSDDRLRGAVTVTVSGKCIHPVTMVAVPVDTVALFLTGARLPGCPESGNNGPSVGKSFGVVKGALTWPTLGETKTGDWSLVPKPIRSTERRAAYVFAASPSPSDDFYLPDPATAIVESATSTAREFSLVVWPGNQTLYAIAGLEDTTSSSRTFVPYAMGVTRGVSVLPGGTTESVVLPFSTVFDQSLRIGLGSLDRTSRGPDRVVVRASVSLGAGQYAALPGAVQSSLLPLSGGITLRGLPALVGALGSEAYVLGAQASSGQAGQPPLSAVGRVRTTGGGGEVTLGGFVPIPAIRGPRSGERWDGTTISFDASGHTLSVVSLAAGAGAMVWTVVTPKGSETFTLPDLSAIPGARPLLPGAIQLSVAAARIDAASYDSIRWSQLYSSGWSAYAVDVAGSYY